MNIRQGSRARGYMLRLASSELQGIIKVRRSMLAIAACLCLGGCSMFNNNYANLQFDADANPAPSSADIQNAASVAGAALKGPIAVSDPQQTVGDTAFSPRRWYICIRGDGNRESIVAFDRFGHAIKALVATASPMCEGLTYSAVHAHS